MNDTINVEHDPDRTQLKKAGVFTWPIWEKEVSEFPWSYESKETCYFLEGEVEVTPDGGRAVTIAKGDLVTFPKGMSCHWNIRKPVRKHYLFS